MEFEHSERVRTAVEEIRAFLTAEVYPLEAQVRSRGFKESLPELGRLRDAAKRLGYFSPHVSAAHGGAGFSLTEFAPISEALGMSPLGHYVFNAQAPDAGNMEILAEFGTEEQKATYLAPLVSGSIRSCFSMTEPQNAGSNPVLMDTQAVLDGDHYVINGHKWFTSSADGAEFAIVMAVTSPEADNPYARASQIIVPMGTPGVELVRNISVMGEPGDDYASHAEMRYTDVRVPVTNLLGGENAGFVIAQTRLGPGRIHHCMRWIGICERAFELMCERAATRMIGVDRPLGTRQFVQGWIADSRAEIDAARLLVLHAAWKIDREGSQAARVEISTIKFFVANILQNVLDRAIQTHGALGLTDDTPLAYWFRHERGARIYDGPDEVHKSVVARSALKKYGVKVK